MFRAELAGGENKDCDRSDARSKLLPDESHCAMQGAERAALVVGSGEGALGVQ
jgi:hypothetical protein